MAIVARATLAHGGEEHRRHVHPAGAARLGDGARDAPAATRLVAVAPSERLELAHAHPGRLENEQGQAVGRRE